MENGNNHAPVAKLYAPLELLKRILPSRESVAPEELAEYDRFMGGKDAPGSEYEAFLLHNGDELTLELRVAPEDMGKVIGRQGRIAKEIRTVVRSYAQRTGVKVSVDIVD